MHWIFLDVDRYGLDHETDDPAGHDEKVSGGPVGWIRLQPAFQKIPEHWRMYTKPYLLKCGFIQRTPRGRVVTDLAYRILEFFLRFKVSGHTETSKNVGFCLQIVYNNR